jgi:hypothetical protein
MENKSTFALINIDRENNKFNRIDIKNISSDLNEYILAIRKAILDEKESRMFNYTSNTTEVIVALKKIISNNNSITKQSEIIAQRLLKIEIETQTRYEQIADIKKGSLFICKFFIEDIPNILIVKIEHSPFIDEIDFKKHIGLPFKNEVLKSSLFQFNDTNEIINIMLHDSNGTIANYWWNSFLELKEISSDEQNTLKAFNTIEKVLNKNLKHQSPADYTLLRNNLIGYFKTKRKFSIKDAVNQIIGSYDPINPEIDISLIKTRVSELPKVKKFDSVFNITPNEIKARQKYIIKISDMVELHIRDHVQDLKSVIHSEIGSDGNKYVKILVGDDVFSLFKYEKE